ncbi:hypothetical protein TKK_0016461 [Trichogramma kaykai]|uniref:Chitin-binding type-2 domain-containing protein n=1 Tax=Trichogramma kaykai TaxID=54128 RepID=A0ABD2W748_9HYME
MVMLTKCAMLILWILSAFVAVALAQEPHNDQLPPLSTDFTCSGRPIGLYADLATNCRAYHTCDEHGNHFAHYCPEATSFRQDAKVCDHAYLVDCKATFDAALLKSSDQLDNRFDATSSHFEKPRSKSVNNVRQYNTNSFLTPNSAERLNNRFRNDAFAGSSDRFGQLNDDSQRSYAAEKHSNFPTTRTDQFSAQNKPLQNSIFSTNSPFTSGPVSNNQRDEEILNEEDSYLIPPPIPNNSNNFQNNFNLKSSSNFNNVDFQPTHKVHQFEKSNEANLVSNNSENNHFTFQTSETNHAHFQTNRNYQNYNNFGSDIKRTFEMSKDHRSNDKFFDSSLESNESIKKPSNLLEPPAYNPNDLQRGRNNVNFRSNINPYLETLKSIQKNELTTIRATEKPIKTTTHEAKIFPAAHQPLLSSDPENDPYYPRPITTTEAYYTPKYEATGKIVFTTTRKPQEMKIKFDVPAALPDESSLSDLLDRRKYFFIPQLKST